LTATRWLRFVAGILLLWEPTRLMDSLVGWLSVPVTDAVGATRATVSAVDSALVLVQTSVLGRAQARHLRFDSSNRHQKIWGRKRYLICFKTQSETEWNEGAIGLQLEIVQIEFDNCWEFDTRFELSVNRKTYTVDLGAAVTALGAGGDLAQVVDSVDATRGLDTEQRRQSQATREWVIDYYSKVAGDDIDNPKFNDGIDDWWGKVGRRRGLDY
jgi:hypothetical protein